MRSAPATRRPRPRRPPPVRLAARRRRLGRPGTARSGPSRGRMNAPRDRAQASAGSRRGAQASSRRLTEGLERPAEAASGLLVPVGTNRPRDPKRFLEPPLSPVGGEAASVEHAGRRLEAREERLVQPVDRDALAVLDINICEEGGNVELWIAEGEGVVVEQREAVASLEPLGGVKRSMNRAELRLVETRVRGLELWEQAARRLAEARHSPLELGAPHRRAGKLPPAVAAPARTNARARERPRGAPKPSRQLLARASVQPACEWLARNAFLPHPSERG